MSKIADELVSELGNNAVRSFSLLVQQVMDQTGQDLPASTRDVARAVAKYRRDNPPTLTAYERILDDVANGRPRPVNFDASGP